MIVHIGNPLQLDFPVYGFGSLLRADLAQSTRVVFMVKVAPDDPDSSALITKVFYPKVLDEDLYEGDGGPVPSGLFEHNPVVSGSVSVSDGVEFFVDDGQGLLTGSLGGSGTIEYATGVYSLTFNTHPTSAVLGSYSPSPGSDILVDTPKVGRIRVVLSSADTSIKLGEFVFALQVEWGSDKQEVLLGGGKFKVIQDVIR